MRKQSIAILSILIGGSLLSIAYATGTVITNTGITTGDLTVTGTCTGCGGEGSFTTYTNIFNGTVEGSDDSDILIIQVSNTGGLVAYNNFNNATVISSTHSVIGFATDAGSNQNRVQYGMSSATGEYKFVFNSSTGLISVFKNNSLLQTFSIDLTQFYLSNPGKWGMGISPDGKYIEVYGPNNGMPIENRLLVFQGS